MKQRSDIFDRLPPELHDRIIDHLHRDRRTLSACSLVCKAWQSSSRYHLFQNAATVRVTRDNIHQFDELLVTGRITPYVGRLSIVFKWAAYRFDDSDSEDVLRKFSDHLCRLMGLVSLKYLRLAGHELRPLTFVRNFASITDLQLNRVSFDSFAQFQELIQCFSLLRRLALIRVHFEQENPEGKSIYLPPVGLQDLVVHVIYAVPIFNWLCSRPIILRNLRWEASVTMEANTFLASPASYGQWALLYNPWSFIIR
ncbi:hypothetical protein C8J57DRAFT_607078 [Mycena rebaudengoi]|nr:hypothetical protein C8J57DRAFT_607078 [Mycena rebaudengoi]